MSKAIDKKNVLWDNFSQNNIYKKLIYIEPHMPICVKG